MITIGDFSIEIQDKEKRTVVLSLKNSGSDTYFGPAALLNAGVLELESVITLQYETTIPGA